MKNIFVIYHGRFPGEKAAALFAAKEAESFLPFGRVTVVAPRRLQRTQQSPQGYYGVSSSVRAAYLPIFDLFVVPGLGALAFWMSNTTFALSLFVYCALWMRREDIVLTNEPLPAYIASFFSRRVVFEVHDFPERHTAFYRQLFARVHTVLCTNEWKHAQLQKQFGVSPRTLLLERNAVEVEKFGSFSKHAARERLGLPQGVSIVVYTGHLYEHKGADVLAEATALVPEVEAVFVGGTKIDVETFTKRWGSNSNIRVVGQRPHEEIPLWQAAADVLVLPNSAHEDISARYTSPMKLFEYMASERPIVASRVPAIQEVLREDVGYFVEADSPEALAQGIRHAITDPEAAAKAHKAHDIVREHSWERRAERIIAQVSR